MFTRHRALCICAGTSGMCCSIEACCWVYKQTSPALYTSTQGESVRFGQSCNMSLLQSCEFERPERMQIDAAKQITRNSRHHASW